MNFSQIIKTAILQIINSIRFSDIYIGEVIKQNPLKIKLEEKLFLDDRHILKASKIAEMKIGQKIILIREYGGQRYFAIDYLQEDVSSKI